MAKYPATIVNRLLRRVLKMFLRASCCYYKITKKTLNFLLRDGDSAKQSNQFPCNWTLTQKAHVSFWVTLEKKRFFHIPATNVCCSENIFAHFKLSVKLPFFTLRWFLNSLVDFFGQEKKIFRSNKNFLSELLLRTFFEPTI